MAQERQDQIFWAVKQTARGALRNALTGVTSRCLHLVPNRRTSASCNSPTPGAWLGDTLVGGTRYCRDTFPVVTDASYPLAGVSTMKLLTWPSWVSRAHATTRSAMVPLAIQGLTPSSNHVSPSRRTVVSRRSSSSRGRARFGARAPILSRLAYATDPGRLGREGARWNAFAPDTTPPASNLRPCDRTEHPCGKGTAFLVHVITGAGGGARCGIKRGANSGLMVPLVPPKV